jgi:hypothetical protein
MIIGLPPNPGACKFPCPSAFKILEQIRVNVPHKHRAETILPRFCLIFKIPNCVMDGSTLPSRIHSEQVEGVDSAFIVKHGLPHAKKNEKEV